MCSELRRGRELGVAYIRARRLLKAWVIVREWLIQTPLAPMAMILDRAIRRHIDVAQAKVEKHLFQSGLPIWVRNRSGNRYIVRLDAIDELLVVEQVGCSARQRLA